MNVNEICKNYGVSKKEFHDTIEMLCAKGVAKGVYQNYLALVAVLEVLTTAEAQISSSEVTE